MAFKKPSDFGGAGFLKPAEHMTDIALLFEPKSIRKDVPHTYNGVTKPRDEMVADVTVFKTEESLLRGRPDAVLKGVTIAYGMVTSALEGAMGEAMPGIIRKVPTRSGAGYALRDVEASHEEMLLAYYENREANINAALNSGDMPDFD